MNTNEWHWMPLFSTMLLVAIPIDLGLYGIGGEIVIFMDPESEIPIRESVNELQRLVLLIGGVGGICGIGTYISLKTLGGLARSNG